MQESKLEASNRQGLGGYCSNAGVLVLQLLVGLHMLGIERNAVDRANLLALWLVIMADAFGTESRIDHIDFLTLRNSVI
ncbi:MAG: hypothetical protein ACI9K8_001544, partial [Reinekea sp.]